MPLYLHVVSVRPRAHTADLTGKASQGSARIYPGLCQSGWRREPAICTWVNAHMWTSMLVYMAVHVCVFVYRFNQPHSRIIHWSCCSESHFPLSLSFLSPFFSSSTLCYVLIMTLICSIFFNSLGLFLPQSSLFFNLSYTHAQNSFLSIYTIR